MQAISQYQEEAYDLDEPARNLDGASEVFSSMELSGPVSQRAPESSMTEVITVTVWIVAVVNDKRNWALK